MDPLHPTDDELIEHLCGEGDTAGRARIDAHLKSCAVCHQAWAEMTAALTMVNDAVPEPPPSFERVMWARVREKTVARPRWTWRVLVPATALAATVLMAVVVGRQVSIVQPVPAPIITPANVRPALTPNDRVLLTALDEHLEQTEALLVELRNAADRDELSSERMTADDLVAAGRLYRQSAEFAGRLAVVRMLEDLEPVLVELARAPARLDGKEREWLRARIADDNLLFKVRAMSSDLKDLAELR